MAAVGSELARTFSRGQRHATGDAPLLRVIEGHRGSLLERQDAHGVLVEQRLAHLLLAAAAARQQRGDGVGEARLDRRLALDDRDDAQLTASVEHQQPADAAAASVVSGPAEDPAKDTMPVVSERGRTGESHSEPEGEPYLTTPATAAAERRGLPREKRRRVAASGRTTPTKRWPSEETWVSPPGSAGGAAALQPRETIAAAIGLLVAAWKRCEGKSNRGNGAGC